MNKRILALVTLCLTAGLLATGCKSPEEIQQSAQAANGVQTIVVRQQPAEELNLLTVTGSATVSTQPDKAVFELAVRTFPQAEEDGAAADTAKVLAVTQALEAHGIPAEQIAASEWYGYPETAVDPEGQPLGYTRETRLTVTVNRFEELALILADAEAAGAVVLRAPEYFLEDSSVHYQEALVQAVEAAQKKALVLAEAMGATLTKQRSLTEGTPLVQAALEEDPASGMLVTAEVTLVYAIE